MCIKMYICPVCGQRLEFISEYHCKLHNMSRDEFINKFKPKKNTFRNFKIATNKNKDIGEEYVIERAIANKKKRK